MPDTAQETAETTEPAMLPEIEAGLAETLEAHGESRVSQSDDSEEKIVSEEAPKEPVATQTENESVDDKETHRRFAEMSRKEREIRRLTQDAQKYQEERKQWETEKEKLSAYKTETESLFQQGRTNPDAVLEKAGLNYNYLTERILNDDKPTAEHEVSSLRDEITQLKQAQEEWRMGQEAREKESAQADYQKQVDQFVYSVGDFVDSSDEYELAKHFGQPAVQQVIDTMAKVYQDSDKSLSNDEATSLVEEAYVKDIEQLFDVPKVQQLIEERFGISLNGKFSKSTSGANSETVTSKTLTNDMASVSAVPETEPVTEEEILSRAARHLRWT